MNAVLEGLNEEQRKAVQCVEGPVLIVAGAGSGKTKVLTCRIANILNMGCEPWRILALTFTKKAASEMKERIALLVGEKAAARLVMGTFHAVFVRFLRQYADFLGYPSNFTIYDSSDSQSAVKACIRELNLDDKVYKPKDVYSKISREKNDLYTVKAYRGSQEKLLADTRAHKGDFIRIYELYQQKLKQSGVMDFDDILVNMNILLRDNPAALDEISGRFDYIMVDEYQDTNYSQYLIMRALAARRRNICVVGDDSQSIYAFRGAKIQNILDFRKDYQGCSIFRLERNYRSTAVIVDAANSLIAHNEGRIPKNCWSDVRDGDLIKLIDTSSDIEESMTVVSEIMGKMRRFGAEYRDFAILYRTNAQSRSLEDALRRRNIPYMVYSGNAFFDRAEVKDLMAYFKLAVNPSDDESFKRVVNKPARGIGDTSLSSLNECARAHSCPLFKAAYMPDLQTFGLKDAAVARIRAFCDMIDAFAISARSAEAYEQAKAIADKSGLYSFFDADKSVEGLSRMGNVDELLNSVMSFSDEFVDEENPERKPTIAEYLENTALLSNADTGEGEDDGNKVALMTAHSAKGLEFPHVFVCGLEENLFPSMTMVSSRSDLEEERRLFYVAMTRAKTTLTLSFSSSRLRNGKTEFNEPSRFVREIDPQYVENPLPDTESGSRTGFSSGFGSFRQPGVRPPSVARPSFGNRPSTAARPSSGNRFPPASRPVFRAPASSPAVSPDPDFKPSDPSEFREGQRVVHIRFGKGSLLELSGDGDKRIARINFDDYGIKSILLKYLKLRIE